MLCLLQCIRVFVAVCCVVFVGCCLVCVDCCVLFVECLLLLCVVSVFVVCC